MHPDIITEERMGATFDFPRPISAPATPASSRAPSPTSLKDSYETDDDEDDVNSDVEREILINGDLEEKLQTSLATSTIVNGK